MHVVPTTRSTSTRDRPALVAGRYHLFGELGAGGMAVVHRAYDTVLDRQVAFKQLRFRGDATARGTDEALFQREYHTLARLRHPRIIQVYDYGVTEGGPYYTMELLDGRDLSDLGSVPFPQACRYMRDVASSLALVHAHRLVHRDVSPRNVRVTDDGQAKLIDFGALAPFGVAPDVVGTPLCMAPEVLHKQRLDQRTDLYALGATGYRLLTGRHAYRVRRTQDLPACWTRAPAPPSALVPDIPRELDLLMLSLLSLDPIERPGDAATVIERLTALGGLEPEEHEYAAQSYALSSRMVGREAELRWLEKRLERALGGQGAEVVLEGPAGIGKTRLLQEFCLESQLRRVVTLKADAQAYPMPFGVGVVLAEGLLAECPVAARAVAAPFAGLVAQLSTELRQRLGNPSLVQLADNPGERRARFVSALRTWFLAVARTETLLLAVDNVQAMDADSAALLAALGRDAQRTRIVVVVTHRSGEPVVAPTPVRMLRQRSGRLRLSGLSAGACDALGKSLFGDVANTGRLARLLYDKSAGVPQHFMDLAQLLVSRRIAKYVDGTWVLPLDVLADELPSRSEEIFDAKLADLNQVARDLLEALSIEPKPVSIERCLALAQGGDDRETYAALDHLVAEQILLFERGHYRFAQQTLREVVTSHMDARARKSRHLLAAESLLATVESVTVRVEAALHLMQAGQDERAADMLARASWEFVASAQAYDLSDQLTRALLAVVAVYETQGRSAHDLATVLFPLVSIAFFSAEWQLVLRYGERALEIGFDINGLRLAYRATRYVGRNLGLALGMAGAKRRFDRAYPRGADFSAPDVIAWCCAVVPAAVGTATICLDTERVQRLKKLTEPLRLFPEGHVARVTYDYAVAHALTVRGRESESRELLERTLPLYDDPAIRQALGKGHSKAIHSGVLFAAGILECYRFGDGALRHAQRIEEIDSHVWVLAADQLRLLYHALRGESERVRYYRERVELFAVQGRSTWQVEVFLPVLLLTADVLTGDTLAARRTWEQLARRARGMPSLEVYADAAQAAYLALRGELELAIGIYEEILPQLPPKERVSWVTIRAHMADALNRAGQHDRARVLLEETLRYVTPKDEALVAHYLEPERQLAIALAGLKNYGEAARILDRLLNLHGREDNPLLVGLLHKARAEVALTMGDAACFRVQLGEMESRFRSTENPALLAQWERLVDQAVRAAGVPSSQLTLRPEFGVSDGEGLVLASSEAMDGEDPYLRVLLAVQHRARAASGHLYLFERNALRRVASTTSDVPPAAAESDLLRLAERAALESREPDRSSRHEGLGERTETSSAEATALSRSILIESARMSPPEHPAHQLLLLTTVHDERVDVVGGVLLEMKAHHLFRLSPQFLENVAKSLEERMITTQ